jgi:hypothetical protein
MSDNNKMHDTENKNEWIDWIEESIDKNQLKYYEYKEFNNFQEIGTGGFGKVYRANWKNLEKHFALKSFFNLDNITVKEIVREVILIINNFFFILRFLAYFIYFKILYIYFFQLRIQCEVDFHDNIICCHGITKFESGNLGFIDLS